MGSITAFFKTFTGGLVLGMAATLAIESRTGGNSGGQLSQLVGKVPLIGNLLLNKKA